MSKQQKQIDKLSENIMLSASVLCNKCHEHFEQNFVSDDYSAAEYFYKQGFRITRADRIYCPDCVKKHLK